MLIRAVLNTYLFDMIASFNDDHGLPESAFMATCELIQHVMGKPARDAFVGHIKCTEGRYYLKPDVNLAELRVFMLKLCHKHHEKIMSQKGENIPRVWIDYVVPEESKWYNHAQLVQLDDKHQQQDILAFLPLRYSDGDDDSSLVKNSQYEAEAAGDLLRHALDAYLNTNEGAWEWEQFCKVRDNARNV